MSEKICIIVKEPGMDPEERWVENELHALQEIVGGYIEYVKMFANAGIIVNEEGILLGLPYNCHLCGMDLYGPVIFIGTAGDRFMHWPSPFHAFKSVFSSLFDEAKQ